MNDLVALRARLDEDERLARLALDEAQQRTDRETRYPYPERLATSMLDARFGPARVLREVEAKRAILARYEDCVAHMQDPEYQQGTAMDQVLEYEEFVLPNLGAEYDRGSDTARPQAD